MSRFGVQGLPLAASLLLPILVALAWTPAMAQSQPAAGPDTVIVGMAGDVDTLNILFYGSYATEYVLYTLFTADVWWDNNWKLYAQGVESFPSLKDGTLKIEGERMIARWRIKPRAWHDGRPVTCSDYVFAFALARDERVASWWRWQVADIANVACPGGASGTEIAVTWKKISPMAGLFVLNSLPALPRHILEPSYRANPARLFEAPYGNDPKATVGDGPYRVVEWRKGESLTVESVGTHAIFGQPKIRRIIFKFLSDVALVQAILSGTIDVVSAWGLWVDHGIKLAQQAAGRFRVIFDPGFEVHHIGFNFDNPLLQDIRVRRAIAHAINRSQIVQQVSAGRFLVANSYLWPGHPGFTDQVQKYPYDPARARALLREVGFTPGSDGMMQDSAGRRLALELVTESEDSGVTRTGVQESTVQQVARIVQQQLRQVGIEVDLVIYPNRVFWREILRRRRFKALALSASLTRPITGCERLFTSAAIPAAPDYRGMNYWGYKNREMDEFCEAAAREIDQAKRSALLRATARIFSRDLPAVPLYVPVFVIATKVGLQNVSPGGFARGETWNAHAWYWR